MNEPFVYADKITPPFYRCAECGASQCKLWRPVHDSSPLRCRACALAHKAKTCPEFDNSSEQIGYLLPAVPCEDGVSWWGYTSVPPEGCVWWRALPDPASTRLNVYEVETERGPKYIVLALTEESAASLVLIEEGERIDGDGIACSGVIAFTETQQRCLMIEDEDGPDESVWDLAANGSPRVLTCSEDY